MTKANEKEASVEWQLKEIPIKELKDHPKNPRQIGKEQIDRLGKLIDKFGLIDKPIVNLDMTIIGGHQRIKVLKKQKVKTVECWVSERHLSEQEIDELCIGLNLHQGSWDWDIMANEFDPADLLQWGFSEKQLFDQFEQLEEAEKILSEEKSSKKKNKVCPNCGHEF